MPTPVIWNSNPNSLVRIRSCNYEMDVNSQYVKMEFSCEVAGNAMILKGGDWQSEMQGMEQVLSDYFSGKTITVSPPMTSPKEGELEENQIAEVFCHVIQTVDQMIDKGDLEKGKIYISLLDIVKGDVRRTKRYREIEETLLMLQDKVERREK